MASAPDRSRQTEREIEKREKLVKDYQHEVSNLEKEVKRLNAIVQAPSTPSLKDELVTLRASLARAVCSVQDMRASARETREVWELTEKALRQENLSLKEEIGTTRQELNRAKSELEGKKLLPFVNRFIQGRGRLVEEVSAPEVPPPTTQATQMERMRHAYMRSVRRPDMHVIFDGLALQRLERADPTSVVLGNAGAAAFQRRLAPELAAMQRAVESLQSAFHRDNLSARIGSFQRSQTSLQLSRNNLSTPKSFRLLVVLWETREVEALGKTLTSIMRKCTPTPHTADCLICTDRFSTMSMVTVEGCGHMMCKRCMQGYIKMKLAESAWPILCPICTTESDSQRKRQVITRLLVNKLLLSAATLNRWAEFERSQFVIQIRCPVAKCEKRNLYDLTEYNRSSVLICTHNPQHSFCRACHCPLVAGRAHGPCGDKALESLAEERKWVRCPKPNCGILVEKGKRSQDYVNCRCGARFCYDCGEDIPIMT